MLAAALAVTSAQGVLAQAAQPSTTTAARVPDVIFVPTPQDVVDAMITMAGVRDGDVLYDLGSGDGRIPVTAAKKFKIRAVGIDIDPQRIKEANANAQQAGVTNAVTFKNADLFQTDFSDATVVTLYLLPQLNEKLMPTLKTLKPGTRIVSHAFLMGDWKPEREQEVNGRMIYLWTVPRR
ncbi:SAM-dependent methyltransferase [Polymorphobacter sp.]|uniref:SAM-dependent methyltransferase n=1 Tax=Polymorphobacter sp. TaxID=1909290 RepID=UPI003F6E5913